MSDLARPRPAAVPLVTAASCAAVTVYGLLAGTGFHYWLSCLITAVAIFGLEADRVARSPAVPWWVMQTFALPWAMIVILPWTLRTTAGRWEVGHQWTLPDLDLPLTWSVNLLALLGFTAGSLVATRNVAVRQVDLGRVRTEPAALTLALIVFAFLVSYVVMGRPLGSFWRLSGDYSYSSHPGTRASFGPLELTPEVAIMFVIALAALRRGYQRRPIAVELVALLLTAMVTLGSGTRSRFILLALGWIFVQCFPVGAATSVGRPVARRRASVLLCGLALAGSFVGLGLIGQARGPTHGGTGTDDALATSINGLDVIGSSEMLLTRGAQLGSFRGATYTSLPAQMVPNILTGGQNQKPLTVQVTDQYLDPHAGYSAPYWMESALNFGRGGTFIFTILIAVLVVRAQLRALSSNRPLAQVLQRAGPVVLFISYQLLSRIASEQVIYTVGSLALGAWLAVRTLPGPVGRPRTAPTTTALHPGIRTAVECRTECEGRRPWPLDEISSPPSQVPGAGLYR